MIYYLRDALLKWFTKKKLHKWTIVVKLLNILTQQRLQNFL